MSYRAENGVLNNFVTESEKPKELLPNKIVEEVESVKREFADSEDGIERLFARLLAYANGTLTEGDSVEDKEYYFAGWSQEDFQKLIKSLAEAKKQWREVLLEMNKDFYKIDGVYEFTEEEKEQKKRDHQYNQLKESSLYRMSHDNFPSIEDLAFLVEYSGRYSRPEKMTLGAKQNEDQRLGMYPNLEPEDFEKALNDLKIDDKLWQEKIDQATEFLKERDSK